MPGRSPLKSRELFRQFMPKYEQAKTRTEMMARLSWLRLLLGVNDTPITTSTAQRARGATTGSGSGCGPFIARQAGADNHRAYMNRRHPLPDARRAHPSDAHQIFSPHDLGDVAVTPRRGVTGAIAPLQATTFLLHGGAGKASGGNNQATPGCHQAA